MKTIHASLAIENNSLSLEQVTDIINGKRILGAPDEICEVKNAFEVYEHLLEMNPYSRKDMLKAHKMLMHDLTKEAGAFRQGGVGAFAGKRLVHMAPPAERVSQLVKELMDRLGLKHRPTFRKNYLLPSMELGLVEMTIPDKPNSSRQKYRKKAVI